MVLGQQSKSSSSSSGITDPKELLRQLADVSGIPLSQLTSLVGTPEQSALQSGSALYNPGAATNLYNLLQLLSEATGEPLKSNDLNSLLYTPEGNKELSELFERLSRMTKRPDNNSDSKKDALASEDDKKDKKDEKEEDRTVPEEVLKQLPADPSAFAYILTQINPENGDMIEPNLIFRANFKNQYPMKPYLLTNLENTNPGKEPHSLLKLFRKDTPGVQGDIYLLSRINEDKGTLEAPYLFFYRNPTTKTRQGPYLLSRLDLTSEAPLEPELFTVLQNTDGAQILDTVIPVLNRYTS